MVLGLDSNPLWPVDPRNKNEPYFPLEITHEFNNVSIQDIDVTLNFLTKKAILLAWVVAGDFKILTAGRLAKAQEHSSFDRPWQAAVSSTATAVLGCAGNLWFFGQNCIGPRKLYNI